MKSPTLNGFKIRINFGRIQIEICSKRLTEFIQALSCKNKKFFTKIGKLFQIERSKFPFRNISLEVQKVLCSEVRYLLGKSFE